MFVVVLDLDIWSSSSLTNRDSSFALDNGELSSAEMSSIMPSARALDALKPLMIAGKVLPSLFFSTSLFENICFRRRFESIHTIRSVKTSAKYD